MKIDNKTTVELSKRYNDVTVDKYGNMNTNGVTVPWIGTTNPTINFDPAVKFDYTTVNYTKAYIDKYVENMFDRIKDYKVYEKTTIVFFSDGTKETVVCCDKDTFDVEQGITMCVLKRMLGDKYKKSVKSIIKAKTLNEKNVKKLEAAHKEAQLREERKEKRNRENKLRMKARYEARLAAAIEEEKKKLKSKKVLNESIIK